MGVIPIYKSGPRFFFDADEGRIAEYAVKMRELPHGWFLGELLAKGAVGETELNRVISRLHQFYESERLRISTNENFEQAKPFVGKTVSSVALEAIRQFTNNFYEANRRLFEERIQQRRIRDCHGDLHLDHIHLTPETVTIYDCIEFNDRFRFIDIANDLAFLAMDFDFERQHKLGDLLLRNAAREFRDIGMLKLADFYKCYRALVRGKIESIQANSEEHAQRARRYFHLALRYSTSGSEPLLLVVMGRIGTGKTTVARQLASELDWPVFSSDQIRKTLSGVPLTIRTAPELRAKVYSEQMTKKTYQNLLKNGLDAVPSHGGVILDATFSNRTCRDLLRDECAKVRVPFQVIELEASYQEIANRLKARNATAGEISDARLEDLETLSAAYEPASELAPNLIKISTDGELSDAIRAVLLRLAEKQSAIVNSPHNFSGT